jgi:CheY-like chemotaxis protein
MSGAVHCHQGPQHVTASSPLVLVIDDDDDVREGLVVLLESAGYTAAGAANGDEALAMLRAGSEPCLILLDLWMPVKTGWGFRMEQMREPRLARIPTVVLSADEARRDMHGVAATLPKPLDFAQLFDLVEYHCTHPVAPDAALDVGTVRPPAFHWLPDWVFDEVVRLAREVGATVVALEARPDELIFTMSSGAVVRRIIPGFGQG